MYIIAIAWIYVVFMMAIVETSIVAGLMTFFFYGALPVSIIVYVMGTGQRKRKRRAQEMQRQEEMKKNATMEMAAAERKPEV